MEQAELDEQAEGSLGDLDETPRRKGGFRQGEPSQTTAPPRVR